MVSFRNLIACVSLAAAVSAFPTSDFNARDASVAPRANADAAASSSSLVARGSSISERSPGRQMLHWSPDGTVVYLLGNLGGLAQLPAEIRNLIGGGGDETIADLVFSNWANWVSGRLQYYPARSMYLDAYFNDLAGGIFGVGRWEGLWGFALWNANSPGAQHLANLVSAIQEWASQNGGNVAVVQRQNGFFTPPDLGNAKKRADAGQCSADANVLQLADRDVPEDLDVKANTKRAPKCNGMPESKSTTVCALSSDGSRVVRWDGSSWKKIGDKASAIFGGATALLATNGDNEEVWHWRPENGWTKIGGGGAQYVVTNDAIFGLNNAKDSVWKYSDGTNWEQIGDAAGAIYGGGDGNLYAVNKDNTEVWHWRSAKNWDKVGGGGTKFAVDGNNVLYGLTGDKSAVFQYSGSGTSWNKIGDAASDIVAGGFGMFATNLDNNEIWHHIDGTNWERVGDGGSNFTVTDEGLYGLTGDGSEIYKWNSGRNWNKLGGSPNAQRIVPCP